MLVDYYPPYEGARSTGIWKRNSWSFPNIESKNLLHSKFCTLTRKKKSWPEFSYCVPQEVDSMRSAYYSDLCSKFMIENTILKMEYAEVRVFSISEKVNIYCKLCYVFKSKKNPILCVFTHMSFSSFSYFLEPYNIMSPGPAVVGHSHQSVLQ